MPSIHGIYCPNIVPFTAARRIHEGELRRMVDWLIGKGISGLYPNGSTGEFIRLSHEDRIRVTEIVVSETGGRVPVLAGASEANIDEVLAACQRYAEIGCAAVSLTGPYYFKVSQESIEQYFREIARRSPIDILLYNIPQYSNEISLPVVKRLALDCPRIVGIKDSSRDFPRLLRTLSLVKPQRPDFAVLTGTEEMLFPSLLMGADGGTIASSGVVPEVILKIYHDFRAGRWDECREIQLKLLDMIEVMFEAGNFPEGFRAGVALRGFDPGPPRFPVGPSGETVLAESRRALACLLASCGFAEAAHECSRRIPFPCSSQSQSPNMEAIVQAVLESLREAK